MFARTRRTGNTQGRISLRAPGVLASEDQKKTHLQKVAGSLPPNGNSILGGIRGKRTKKHATNPKKIGPSPLECFFLKGRNTLRLRPGADASRHPQSCPSRAPGSSRPRSQRIPPRTPRAGWGKKKANKATQKWWFLGHPNGNLVFLVVSRNSKGWC